MKALMVGNALDTNGQKYRYVEAAKRYGTDPDVLKALIVGTWDGAGIPARFAKASEHHDSLSIRSAHKASAYFDFPRDILWSRGTHLEVMQLAQDADVIHLTNDVKAYIGLKLPKIRKPAVLHHHGTLFRSQHSRLMGEAKRFHMVQAVSTLDLLRYGKGLEWLPAPLDLDSMAEMRELGRRDSPTVRVVSSPTRRELKSTNHLIAAVETLRSEGLDVELVLVEGRTWAECLAVKATADIYFDQVAVPDMDYPGGYGCNAIEAWGMGIPVIAGADEFTTKQMRDEFGDLPFYEATQSSIVDAVRALVKVKSLRTRWGRIGRAHAEKYHAEKPALTRLASLYHKAIELRESAGDDVVEAYPRTPGRFVAQRKRLVVGGLGSRSVRFTDGVAEVTDPDLAYRLRRLIAFDNRHQISEVFDVQEREALDLPRGEAA